MPSVNGQSDTQNPAVSGINTAANGIGIYGKGHHAGQFDGNVTVNDPDHVALSAFSTNGIGLHAQGGKYAGSFDGSVVVTGDIVLPGADCAEEFDVAEAGPIEPGTVVVLDADGALQQSKQAYDKRVAGVISGAGDYKPGLILDRQQSHDHRVPIALIGKVYCKVDAEYGPIDVGDLLTTSPTPGHAMKAEDPFKAFGAVIGKALRTFEVGQGMIPILIALQ